MKKGYIFLLVILLIFSIFLSSCCISIPAKLFSGILSDSQKQISSGSQKQEDLNSDSEAFTDNAQESNNDQDPNKQKEERWEGIWYQEDPGEFAFHFTADSRWELGWKGDDFFAETFGDYMLTEDKIIFYSGNQPKAEPLICRREGDLFWFGTGEVTKTETEGVEGPNLVTIGPDGKYYKHSGSSVFINPEE